MWFKGKKSQQSCHGYEQVDPGAWARTDFFPDVACSCRQPRQRPALEKQHCHMLALEFLCFNIVKLRSTS